MKVLVVVIALLLSACAHKQEPVKPEQVIAKQVEYVVRIPPNELLALPPAVKNLDVDNAKQSDIARWILLNEERTRALENMILGIATFFKLEQQKLDKQAEDENKKALEKSIDDQAKSADSAIEKPVKK
jgi:hypothetical protein